METFPEMRLAIVDHSDSTGDFNYNVDLSHRRAETVRKTLLAAPYNLAETRLVAMGAGSINPLASNLSDEGRGLNRRVEFVLLDEGLIETASSSAAPADTGGSRFIENEVIHSLVGNFTFKKGLPNAGNHQTAV